MLSATTLMWLLMGATVFVGIPFTLWWWKQADKWADAEHKRFKSPEDTRERIVVRGPGTDQQRKDGTP
ncbi:MAG: hypothetical protein WAZ94_06575 [Phycisphaerales bacterium]